MRYLALLLALASMSYMVDSAAMRGDGYIRRANGTVHHPSVSKCGTERWSVKTGTDTDAHKVVLGSSKKSTIATMNNWVCLLDQKHSFVPFVWLFLKLSGRDDADI
jgi:hypothetical protein